MCKLDTNYIYLSSTSFRWYEFSDAMWKHRFRQYLSDEITHFNNRLSYMVDVIDPLEVISDQADIVDKDLKNISKSKFVVCYLSKRLTIGTLMELSYCVYNKIPLVLIDKLKIHRHHPWIKYWVKTIVDNELDAVYHIKNILWETSF